VLERITRVRSPEKPKPLIGRPVYLRTTRWSSAASTRRATALLHPARHPQWRSADRRAGSRAAGRSRANHSQWFINYKFVINAQSRERIFRSASHIRPPGL